MTALSDKNKHVFDDRITFRDEGHKYWVDGDDKDLVSSTTFIHSFFSDFDSDTIIKNILKSKKHKDPSYKYYNMKAKEIKKIWDDNSKNASGEGTKLHKNIEDFYNNIQVENDSEEFKQFLNFYKDHKDLTHAY